MKKSHLFIVLVLLFTFIGMDVSVLAQNEPVLYFCEKYGRNGEEGISDRFTTGYITVMVKCDYALNLDDVAIQYDKYNFRTGDFEYYKKFNFTVQPDMKYVYFARNDESDLKSLDFTEYFCLMTGIKQ